MSSNRYVPFKNEKGNECNIAINKFQIDDIKQKANRDLRSAIQLLQFFTAGKLGNQPLVNPTKKLKLTNS